MIRYRLRERIADYEFESGRKLTYTEIARETGVTRVTLSKLATKRGYTTTTHVLDRLCKFFNCDVGDLAEYVPDDRVEDLK